jgi:hypothetical protein
MKKVIRLTESDLARIVRRVIKENETTTSQPVSTEDGKTAFKEIKAGVDGKDYDRIAQGIYKIKTKEDYDTVMRHIHKYVGKYSLILDYVCKVWGNWADGSNFFGVATSSNDWMKDLSRHLYQFNKTEAPCTKKTFFTR